MFSYYLGSTLESLSLSRCCLGNHHIIIYSFARFTYCIAEVGFSITLCLSRCAPCTDMFLRAFAWLEFYWWCMLLTVLNLTVATGTINGLIFYATNASYLATSTTWLALQFGLYSTDSSILSRKHSLRSNPGPLMPCYRHSCHHQSHIFLAI